MTATESNRGRTGRRVLAGFFTLAGILHLVRPRMYEQIMPPYLPAHHELVLISGIAEITGGVGVLIPATRQAAGWGLVALLIAVFPANLYMATNADDLKGVDVSPTLLYARLPLQLVLIVLVLRLTRRPR